MKNLFIAVFAFLLLFFYHPATACTTCNQTLQTAIFNSRFLNTLLLMILPFAILGFIVRVISRLK